jgi:hypothetical protein
MRNQWAPARFGLRTSPNLATEWTAVGAAPPGFTGNWYIRTYVICAAPPAKYSIVKNSSPADSQSYKEVSATCGAGLTMLSAGFWMVKSPDTAVPRNVGVASMLLDGPSTVYIDAHAQQNGGGGAGGWQLQTTSICAQLPGATIADTQTSGRGGLVYCPSGTKVPGVFGGILEDSGDAFLDEIRPGNLALEDGVTYMTQAPSAGKTEIQAICAP